MPMTENFSEEKRLRLKNHPKPNFELVVAVPKDDITFTLFNKDNDVGQKVTEETVNSLIVEKKRETKVFIHGWVGSDENLWYPALRREYLQKGDYNIVFVNWKKIANLSYSVSCASVRAVADHIVNLLVASNIESQKIHLIGHSLGAHVAGYTGKIYQTRTDLKIQRITALDTAGPAWEHPELEEENRLNKEDANFVDVHHSDIHVFGYAKPIGHVDFYTNGGFEQPGSKHIPLEKEYSNHDRAVWYFVESLSTKTKAKESTFKEIEEWRFEVKPIKNGREIIFQEDLGGITGIFYYETNSKSPYLKASKI